MTGVGFRHRGGRRPKAPRDRHARSARRGHCLPGNLNNSNTWPSRSISVATASLGQPAARDGTPAGVGRPARVCGNKSLGQCPLLQRSLQGAGAATCLRARPTDSLRESYPPQSLWVWGGKWLESKNTWRPRVPAATQSTWTRDTHASDPNPDRSRSSTSRSSTRSPTR